MAHRIFSILMTILFLATQSVFGRDSIDSINPPPCVVPTIPANGNNFWNVLAFDGFNKFGATDFKGYYQAIDGHEPISFIKNGVTVYSFKFKPTLDGWSTLQSPSDALASNGAKADYIGCPVPVDNFSIRTKRVGFPCGYYGITIKNLEQGDGFSLKLDVEGDGVFEDVETCTGCNVSGVYPIGNFLGPKSVIEFDAFDSKDSFNIELVFEYVLPVSFAFAEKSTICLGESTKIYIGGSEKYTWTPATVPEDPTGFNKTVIATPSVTTNYRAISNVAGCTDTVFVNVIVLPKDTTRRDSVSCNVLTTSSLTYNLKNNGGCDSIEIVTLKSAKQDTTILPILSRCNPSDTVTKVLTLKNIGGCDSLVIQRFKLSAADTVLRDSVVCKPLIVNILTYKFKSSGGCDSIEIVTLKSAKQDTMILPILSRCNPSDTATKVLTLKNIGGCDSLVIQRYKLSSADTVLRDSFICKPLISNTLTYTFKNNSGCDSVEIVTLKLLKQDTTLLPILSRCNPSDTVTKVLTFKNIGGCDSLVIQRFKLSSADTILRDSFICKPLISNTLTYKFKNNSGCDSVEIVTLKSAKQDTILLPILSRCNPSDTATKVLTLKNVGGCDSLVIQRFKLSAAHTVRRDSTINTPLSSGATSITRAFKNRFGCDSIEIISLKLLRCDTTILAAQMRCDARDTLTQIKRFPNAYGCDSVVIQPFILASKDSTVINLTSCNERDTSTIVTVLSNYLGCDSVIIRRTKWVSSGILTQLNLEKSLTCFGDSTGEIVLKSLVGGKPPYQIAWSNGSSNERIQGLIAGKYTVSVTDARGCTVRDSLVIAAPTPLSISTQIKPPRCFEEANGSFTITEINGGIAPYRFQYAGKNIALERLPYSLTNLPAQRYNFSVTDGKGCKAVESINLPQPQQLAVYFNENSLLLKLGDSIKLSPQLNFTPRSLKWTPNVYLNCDTCLSPFVLPKATTNYKIEAFNENGCSVSEFINIKLSKERNVFAPNSFSPNGDSENDYFTIFTDGTVERIKFLEIYNRWGGKIFDNKNFLPNLENEGWDGTFNGKNAEAGVYVYYFIVVYKDGKEAMFKGEVSLIR